MKKNLVFLSALFVVLTFAVSGFSKQPNRKLAQMTGATEKEIGQVKAFEREFSLSFEACQQNTKYTEGGKNRNPSFNCEIEIFPDSDEIEGLSDSLDGLDTHVIIKQDQYNNDITVRLYVNNNGYEINVNWWPGNNNETSVSKEEFLAAAKQLTTKFPKASTKFIKVVH